MHRYFLISRHKYKFLKKKNWLLLTYRYIWYWFFFSNLWISVLIFFNIKSVICRMRSGACLSCSVVKIMACMVRYMADWCMVRLGLILSSFCSHYCLFTRFCSKRNARTSTWFNVVNKICCNSKTKNYFSDAARNQNFR